MRVFGRKPPMRNESNREGGVSKGALHLLPVWIQYDRSEREHVG